MLGIDRHFKIKGPPRELRFQLADAPKAEVTCPEGTDGAKLENSMICYTVNRLLKNTPAPPRQWNTKKPK